MPLISVYSPKGGVGKTTLTANLCYSLASMGLKAIAVDFDSQNALRLHFGVPLSDDAGFVPHAAQSAVWSEYVVSNRDNVFVLPHGKASKKQFAEYEQRLASDDLFVARGLHSLLNQPDLIVIADLPSNHSAVRNALLPLTDLLLIPLLADTASLSLLPQVEDLLDSFHASNQDASGHIVLNQADYRRKMSKDVESFLRERFPDELLGIVHRDESVAEANAEQKSIFDVNYASIAAFDIEVISKKVSAMLGIQIGDGSTYAHADYPNNA
ncbi:cellulose synthase operon protein YhjQ [Vibrio xiamenensis]|uniref:Cellulose synthase operon protein YhjQ n=1 Tax=Vibrio xiamenensis TaxID=861298 RepID=A0A1G8ETL2_9VIBR|nr:cellulose biosynthesis protein BcsQ [Vibrio xiamenensis]SDH73206.1 cellulose synthase operon protein YhjQ [Vibrio xiamenensis]